MAATTSSTGQVSLLQQTTERLRSETFQLREKLRSERDAVRALRAQHAAELRAERSAARRRHVELEAQLQDASKTKNTSNCNTTTCEQCMKTKALHDAELRKLNSEFKKKEQKLKQQINNKEISANNINATLANNCEQCAKTKTLFEAEMRKLSSDFKKKEQQLRDQLNEKTVPGINASAYIASCEQCAKLKALHEAELRRLNVEFKKKEQQLKGQLNQLKKIASVDKSDGGVCQNCQRLNTDLLRQKENVKDLEERLQKAVDADRLKAADLRAQHEKHVTELSKITRANKHDAHKLLEELKTKDRIIEQLRRSAAKARTKGEDAGNEHTQMRKLREEVRKNEQPALLAPACDPKPDTLTNHDKYRQNEVELKVTIKQRDQMVCGAANEELSEQPETDTDSAVFSAPSSLSPQPCSPATASLRDHATPPPTSLSPQPSEGYTTPPPGLWPDLDSYLDDDNGNSELSMAKRQVRELERALLVTRATKSSSRHVTALSERVRQLEEREAELLRELGDLREQNELLEFRVLELAECPDKSSISTTTWALHDHCDAATATDDVPERLNDEPIRRRIADICSRVDDLEDKKCLMQVLVLLLGLDELSRRTEPYNIEAMQIYNEREQTPPISLTSIRGTRDRLGPDRDRLIAKVSPFTGRIADSDDDRESPLRSHESSTSPTPVNSRGTQTDVTESISEEEDTTKSLNLTAEVRKLDKLRETIDRNGRLVVSGTGCVGGCEQKHTRQLEFYRERVEVLERKLNIYESSGEDQARQLAERLSREVLLEAHVKQLTATVNKLQSENYRLEEERCELEEAENDTRLRCQRLETDILQLERSKMAAKRRARECRQQANYWEKMVNKYEESNYELEERECELRHRLEIMEKTAPAILFFNMWKMLQDDPKFDVANATINKLRRAGSRGTQSSCSSRSKSRSPNRKDKTNESCSCGVMGNQIKVLEDERDKLIEAKQDMERKVRALETQLSDLKQSSSTVPLSASAPFSEGPSATSLMSGDFELISTVQQLKEREGQMKKRIEELERREAAYMETLQQADEIWAEMENGYKKRITDAEQSEADMRDRLRRLEKNKPVNYDEIDNTERELAAQTQRLSRENIRLQQERKRLEEELACLCHLRDEKSRELETRVDKLKGELDSERRRSQSLEQRLVDGEAAFTEALRTHSAETEALRERLARTANELVHLEVTNGELREEVETLESKIAEVEIGARTQAETDEQTIKGLSQELNERDSELAEFKRLEIASRAGERLGTALEGVKTCSACAHTVPPNLVETLEGVRTLCQLMSCPAQRPPDDTQVRFKDKFRDFKKTCTIHTCPYFLKPKLKPMISAPITAPELEPEIKYIECSTNICEKLLLVEEKSEELSTASSVSKLSSVELESSVPTSEKSSKSGMSDVPISVDEDEGEVEPENDVLEEIQEKGVDMKVTKGVDIVCPKRSPDASTKQCSKKTCTAPCSTSSNVIDIPLKDREVARDTSAKEVSEIAEKEDKALEVEELSAEAQEGIDAEEKEQSTEAAEESAEVPIEKVTEEKENPEISTESVGEEIPADNASVEKLNEESSAPVIEEMEDSSEKVQENDEPVQWAEDVEEIIETLSENPSEIEEPSAEQAAEIGESSAEIPEVNEEIIEIKESSAENPEAGEEIVETETSAEKQDGSEGNEISPEQVSEVIESNAEAENPEAGGEIVETGISAEKQDISEGNEILPEQISEVIESSAEAEKPETGGEIVETEASAEKQDISEGNEISPEQVSEVMELDAEAEKPEVGGEIMETETSAEKQDISEANQISPEQVSEMIESNAEPIPQVEVTEEKIQPMKQVTEAGETKTRECPVEKRMQVKGVTCTKASCKAPCSTASKVPAADEASIPVGDAQVQVEKVRGSLCSKAACKAPCSGPAVSSDKTTDEAKTDVPAINQFDLVTEVVVEGQPDYTSIEARVDMDKEHEVQGITVEASVTESGNLELITESPPGLVEHTMEYTPSGNVEITTGFVPSEAADLDEVSTYFQREEEPHAPDIESQEPSVDSEAFSSEAESIEFRETMPKEEKDIISELIEEKESDEPFDAVSAEPEIYSEAVSEDLSSLEAMAVEPDIEKVSYGPLTMVLESEVPSEKVHDEQDFFQPERHSDGVSEKSGAEPSAFSEESAFVPVEDFIPEETFDGDKEGSYENQDAITSGEVVDEPEKETDYYSDTEVIQESLIPVSEITVSELLSTEDKTSIGSDDKVRKSCTGSGDSLVALLKEVTHSKEKLKEIEDRTGKPPKDEKSIELSLIESVESSAFETSEKESVEILEKISEEPSEIIEQIAKSPSEKESILSEKESMLSEKESIDLSDKESKEPSSSAEIETLASAKEWDEEVSVSVDSEFKSSKETLEDQISELGAIEEDKMEVLEYITIEKVPETGELLEEEYVEYISEEGAEFEEAPEEEEAPKKGEETPKEGEEAPTEGEEAPKEEEEEVREYTVSEKGVETTEIKKAAKETKKPCICSNAALETGKKSTYRQEPQQPQPLICLCPIYQNQHCFPPDVMRPGFPPQPMMQTSMMPPPYYLPCPTYPCSSGAYGFYNIPAPCAGQQMQFQNTQQPQQQMQEQLLQQQKQQSIHKDSEQQCEECGKYGITCSENKQSTDDQIIENEQPIDVQEEQSTDDQIIENEQSIYVQEEQLIEDQNIEYEQLIDVQSNECEQAIEINEWEQSNNINECDPTCTKSPPQPVPRNLCELYSCEAYGAIDERSTEASEKESAGTMEESAEHYIIVNVEPADLVEFEKDGTSEGGNAFESAFETLSDSVVLSSEDESLSAKSPSESKPESISIDKTSSNDESVASERERTEKSLVSEGERGESYAIGESESLKETEHVKSISPKSGSSDKSPTSSKRSSHSSGSKIPVLSPTRSSKSGSIEKECITSSALTTSSKAPSDLVSASTKEPSPLISSPDKTSTKEQSNLISSSDKTISKEQSHISSSPKKDLSLTDSEKSPPKSRKESSGKLSPKLKKESVEKSQRVASESGKASPTRISSLSPAKESGKTSPIRRSSVSSAEESGKTSPIRRSSVSSAEESGKTSPIRRSSVSSAKESGKTSPIRRTSLSSAKESGKTSPARRSSLSSAKESGRYSPTKKSSQGSRGSLGNRGAKISFHGKDCTCKECKCNPCKDERIPVRKRPDFDALYPSEGGGCLPKCKCEICRCKNCVDPNMAKPLPCDCGVCECEPCKDPKILEAKKQASRKTPDTSKTSDIESITENSSALTTNISEPFSTHDEQSYSSMQHDKYDGMKRPDQTFFVSQETPSAPDQEASSAAASSKRRTSNVTFDLPGSQQRGGPVASAPPVPATVIMSPKDTGGSSSYFSATKDWQSGLSEVTDSVERKDMVSRDLQQLPPNLTYTVDRTEPSIVCDNVSCPFASADSFTKDSDLHITHNPPDLGSSTEHTENTDTNRSGEQDLLNMMQGLKQKPTEAANATFVKDPTLTDTSFRPIAESTRIDTTSKQPMVCDNPSCPFSTVGELSSTYQSTKNSDWHETFNPPDLGSSTEYTETDTSGGPDLLNMMRGLQQQPQLEQQTFDRPAMVDTSTSTCPFEQSVRVQERVVGINYPVTSYSTKSVSVCPSGHPVDCECVECICSPCFKNISSGSKHPPPLPQNTMQQFLEPKDLASITYLKKPPVGSAADTTSAASSLPSAVNDISCPFTQSVQIAGRTISVHYPRPVTSSRLVNVCPSSHPVECDCPKCTCDPCAQNLTKSGTTNKVPASFQPLAESSRNEIRACDNSTCPYRTPVEKRGRAGNSKDPPPVPTPKKVDAYPSTHTPDCVCIQCICDRCLKLANASHPTPTMPDTTSNATSVRPVAESTRIDDTSNRPIMSSNPCPFSTVGGLSSTYQSTYDSDFHITHNPPDLGSSTEATENTDTGTSGEQDLLNMMQGLRQQPTEAANATVVRDATPTGTSFRPVVESTRIDATSNQPRCSNPSCPFSTVGGLSSTYQSTYDSDFHITHNPPDLGSSTEATENTDTGTSGEQDLLNMMQGLRQQPTEAANATFVRDATPTGTSFRPVVESTRIDASSNQPRCSNPSCPFSTVGGVSSTYQSTYDSDFHITHNPPDLGSSTEATKNTDTGTSGEQDLLNMMQGLRQQPTEAANATFVRDATPTGTSFRPVVESTRIDATSNQPMMCSNPSCPFSTVGGLSSTYQSTYDSDWHITHNPPDLGSSTEATENTDTDRSGEHDLLNMMQGLRQQPTEAANATFVRDETPTGTLFRPVVESTRIGATSNQPMRCSNSSCPFSTVSGLSSTFQSTKDSDWHITHNPPDLGSSTEATENTDTDRSGEQDLLNMMQGLRQQPTEAANATPIATSFRPVVESTRIDPSSNQPMMCNPCPFSTVGGVSSAYQSTYDSDWHITHNPPDLGSSTEATENTDTDRSGEHDLLNMMQGLRQQPTEAANATFVRDATSTGISFRPVVESTRIDATSSGVEPVTSGNKSACEDSSCPYMTSQQNVSHSTPSDPVQPSSTTDSPCPFTESVQVGDRTIDIQYPRSSDNARGVNVCPSAHPVDCDCVRCICNPCSKNLTNSKGRQHAGSSDTEPVCPFERSVIVQDRKISIKYPRSAPNPKMVNICPSSHPVDCTCVNDCICDPCSENVSGEAHNVSNETENVSTHNTNNNNATDNSIAGSSVSVCPLEKSVNVQERTIGIKYPASSISSKGVNVCPSSHPVNCACVKCICEPCSENIPDRTQNIMNATQNFKTPVTNNTIAVDLSVCPLGKTVNVQDRTIDIKYPASSISSRTVNVCPSSHPVDCDCLRCNCGICSKNIGDGVQHVSTSSESANQSHVDPKEAGAQEATSIISTVTTATARAYICSCTYSSVPNAPAVKSTTESIPNRTTISSGDDLSACPFEKSIKIQDRVISINYPISSISSKSVGVCPSGHNVNCDCIGQCICDPCSKNISSEPRPVISLQEAKKEDPSSPSAEFLNKAAASTSRTYNCFCNNVESGVTENPAVENSGNATERQSAGSEETCPFEKLIKIQDRNIEIKYPRSAPSPNTVNICPSSHPVDCTCVQCTCNPCSKDLTTISSNIPNMDTEAPQIATNISSNLDSSCPFGNTIQVQDRKIDINYPRSSSSYRAVNVCPSAHPVDCDCVQCICNPCSNNITGKIPATDSSPLARAYDCKCTGGYIPAATVTTTSQPDNKLIKFADNVACPLEQKIKLGDRVIAIKYPASSSSIKSANVCPYTHPVECKCLNCICDPCSKNVTTINLRTSREIRESRQSAGSEDVCPFEKSVTVQDRNIGIKYPRSGTMTIVNVCPSSHPVDCDCVTCKCDPCSTEIASGIHFATPSDDKGQEVSKPGILCTGTYSTSTARAYDCKCYPGTKVDEAVLKNIQSSSSTSESASRRFDCLCCYNTVSSSSSTARVYSCKCSTNILEQKGEISSASHNKAGNVADSNCLCCYDTVSSSTSNSRSYHCKCSTDFIEQKINVSTPTSSYNTAGNVTELKCICSDDTVSKSISDAPVVTNQSTVKSNDFSDTVASENDEFEKSIKIADRTIVIKYPALSPNNKSVNLCQPKHPIDCTCKPCSECIQTPERKISPSSTNRSEQIEKISDKDIAIKEPASSDKTVNMDSATHHEECRCLHCICKICTKSSLNTTETSTPTVSNVEDNQPSTAGADSTDQTPPKSIKFADAICPLGKQVKILERTIDIKYPASSSSLKSINVCPSAHPVDCDCVKCICAPCSNAATGVSNVPLRAPAGGSGTDYPPCPYEQKIKVKDRVIEVKYPVSSVSSKSVTVCPSGNAVNCQCVKCICNPCSKNISNAPQSEPTFTKAKNQGPPANVSSPTIEHDKCICGDFVSSFTGTVSTATTTGFSSSTPGFSSSAGPSTTSAKSSSPTNAIVCTCGDTTSKQYSAVTKRSNDCICDQSKTRNDLQMIPHSALCDCPECFCNPCAPPDYPSKKLPPSKLGPGFFKSAKPSGDAMYQGQKAPVRAVAVTDTEKRNLDTKTYKQKLLSKMETATTERECSCIPNESVPVEPTKLEAAESRSFENTISGLQCALAYLQEKCHKKDRMIAAFSEELRLRANSGVFDSVLHNIAAEREFKLSPDFDRVGAASMLPNPQELRKRQVMRTPAEKPCAPAPIRPLSTPSKSGTCKCATDNVDPSPLAIIEIRRIAPDSLLVKWERPASQMIKGYEVEVNGETKSRVHSAGRNATVINGLMISEVLNLSVFAIKLDGNRCSPGATAVYKPHPPFSEKVTGSQCTC